MTPEMGLKAACVALVLWLLVPVVQAQAGGAESAEAAAASAASAAPPRAPRPATPGPRTPTRTRTALELCLQQPPIYPSLALRTGLEGRTLLRFAITAEGGVQPSVVDQSSGHALLDEAALAHFERCRAGVIAQAGAALPVGLYRLPITWRLE
jgi:protein TonB